MYTDIIYSLIFIFITEYEMDIDWLIFFIIRKILASDLWNLTPNPFFFVLVLSRMYVREECWWWY